MTDDNQSQSFGEYIRSQRQEFGLRQEESIHHFGVGRDDMLMWENEGRVPSRSHYDRLTEILGLNSESIASELRLAGSGKAQSHTLGDMIKRKRSKLNMTQKDIGRCFSVGPSTVCDWESC